MDWNSFTKKLVIRATPSRIYEHWLIPKLIEKWFLRNCVYFDPNGHTRKDDELAKTGDHYLWEWYNWDGQEKGEILLLKKDQLIRFNFSESTVDVKLREIDRGTLVSLTQSGIPDDEENKYNVYYGCGTAWSFWLANLKAYLEHGIILHDKAAPMEGPADLIEFVNV